VSNFKTDSAHICP